MTHQKTFFDAEFNDDMAAKRLARPTDPETSQAAARHVAATLNKRQQDALAAIRRWPGRTGRELNELCRGDIHKRLKELERLGLIKRCTMRPCNITGHSASTWTVAEPR